MTCLLKLKPLGMAICAAGAPPLPQAKVREARERFTPYSALMTSFSV